MTYELNINTEYLRDTLPSTTPDPVGGENNPEEGKCNNFKLRNNEGRNENPENKITHISLSYTVGDYESSLNNFLNKGVGTHYLVKKDGSIDKLVDTQYAPYALGLGALTGALNPENTVGVNKLNNFAVTLHLVNDGKTSYSDDQIEATAHLLEEIVDKNGIDPKFVIPHSDYASARHFSPGPYFPWEELAQAKKSYDVKYNFGVFSFKEREENPEVIVSKDHLNKKDVATVQTKLEEYGIKVVKEDNSNLGEFDLATQRGIVAFNLHHKGEEICNTPELLAAWNKWWENTGKPQGSEENLAELKAIEELAVWDSNNNTIADDLISQYAVELVG